MQSNENTLGIKLVNIEESDARAIQVMSPGLYVKQSGFKEFESVFLVQMTLNDFIKKPADDPRGWPFRSDKQLEKKADDADYITVSINPSKLPDEFICSDVVLRECKIIRKAKADGSYENTLQVELCIG